MLQAQPSGNSCSTTNYHLSLASLIIKHFNKSSHAKRIARHEINM